MGGIGRFEEIEAWRAARELANLVYDLSDKGAFARDWALRDQIRRAAVSVMSNIAEGFESQTNRAFIAYLYRAKGSAGEVRCQLYIAGDRAYVPDDQLHPALTLAEKTARLTAGFIRYLESVPDPKPGARPK
jgi:four helix bundle protein